MTNNFQINTVYSDLLSKAHYQSDNGLWKVSPNIQYLFGNYLSSLRINKKVFKLLFILFIKQELIIENVCQFFLNIFLKS